MSGLVAVVVGMFLVIAGRIWDVFDGTAVQGAVVVVLFAAASGCTGAAFVGVGRPATTTAQPVLGDWRRHERIDRQFGARPPAMAPEDRDVVIARAARSIEGAVVAAARSVWIPISWVLAWAALLVSGLASVDRLTLLLIPPVFTVVQSSTFIAVVTTAGRAAAAQERAERLPVTTSPTHDDAREQRNRDPRGSKVELPDG